MKRRFWMAAFCAVLGFTTLSVAQTPQEGGASTVSLAECPVEMTNNWWPGLLIPRATVSGAEPGSRIVMKYELIAGAKDPKFSFCSNYGKVILPGFEGTESDSSQPDRLNLPITADGTYTYTITQETIDKLKDSEFHGWDGNVRIVGQGFKITSLELVTGDVEEPEQPEEANGESLAECPVDMANNWWPGLLIPRAKVTDATPGNQIVMDYEVLPESKDPRFSLCSDYGKTSLPGFEGTESDSSQPGRLNFPLKGNGTYVYTITQETIDKLKDSGFHGWDGNVRIVGEGFKVTKLMLVEGGLSSIEETLVDNDENAPVEYYNLQGMRVNEPAAGGLYIRRQGNKVTKIIVR